MRIIGGTFRSRRIQSLKGSAVRPTPDRLRETLFDILGASLSGRVFVDAYAGCGTVGIEAVSRGAERVIFLERSHGAVAVIRGNLRALGITGGVEIHQGKAARLLEGYSGDIVFLDPPYQLGREYEASLAVLGRQAPPLVIVQHEARRELSEVYGHLHRVRFLRQGDNALSFFAPAVEGGSQPLQYE